MTYKQLDVITCAWCISNWLIKKISKLPVVGITWMIITIYSFLAMCNLVLNPQRKGGLGGRGVKFPVLLNLANIYMNIVNKSDYKGK